MEINSVDDFKKSFTTIFRESIYPQLNNFDKERVAERKKTFNICGILAVLGACGIIAGSCFIKGDIAQLPIALGVFAIIGCFVVYSIRQKDFETKLKMRIMPMLMKAFGNMTWTQDKVIDYSEIKSSEIFGHWEDLSTDDNFYGSYRDMPLKISEAHLTYETRDSKGRRTTHTRFKGALISIGVGKNFTGHTIVRKRVMLGNKRVYEEVKLEDPEFSKMFYVDSNDQVEARFVLTTAFMERFKNIKNAFGASHAECAFKDNKIMLALSTKKDLFALGGFNKPMTDTKQFQTFMMELISIYEMIDLLKVTEKTGL